MNRIIISFTILAILVAYGIYSENYLVNFCDESYRDLEICGDNIKKEAYGEAEAVADKLLDKWEKRNLLLSVIVGNSDISESYSEIVAISRCLKDALYDDCLMLIRECQGNISEISEENKLNFNNIL